MKLPPLPLRIPGCNQETERADVAADVQHWDFVLRSDFQRSVLYYFSLGLFSAPVREMNSNMVITENKRLTSLEIIACICVWVRIWLFISSNYFYPHLRSIKDNDCSINKM